MSQSIGINFALKGVTVTQAREDGTMDNIGSHTPSLAYQEFFQHLLDSSVSGSLDTRPGEEIENSHTIPRESQLEDVKSLLLNELEKALTMIANPSGVAVEVILAVSVPHHWNTTATAAVFRAAEAAKIPLAGIQMLLKLPRALERAYQLDLVADEYCFVAVDYNSTYLHLFLCESDKRGGYSLVESQAQLAHSGEISTSRANYREETLESIKKFVSLASERETCYGGQIPFQDIKAVILSGDASEEAMQGMKGILQQVFGRDLLRDSITPRYTASIGAASRARLQVEDPKTTEDYITCIGYT